MTNKVQLCRIIYYSIVPWLLYMFRAILLLIIRSINYSFWFYSRVSLSAADNSAKHVELSRNNGIINCHTQLHLVGHFYKMCFMMYKTMNVKCAILLLSDWY
jgi:hypothetical protein